MTKLILDIGNTRTKIALFKDHKILDLKSVKGDFTDDLRRMLVVNEQPESCIISNVKLTDDDLKGVLDVIGKTNVFYFRSGLRLPVKILYKTPETLGNDRLANACGAWKLNKNHNNLIVDMGTCIKFDFVSSNGDYHGGSISPGLMMRYKALTRFTGQLPYFKPTEEFPALIGQSTEGSIRSGVENGILEEITGIIKRYKEVFDQTDIILTGGDHAKFADKLKSPIFVAPNLTLIGLNEILDCNDH